MARYGMAGTTLEERLQAVLANRDRGGELRRLQPRWGVSGQAASSADFFSNDYLGFARSHTLHQTIMAACAQLAPPYNGATGSRLLSGHSEPMEALEGQLATFFKSQACLVFSSGYQANLSVFSTLPQRGDVVWYDAHIHASVKDGVRLGYAEYHAFSHNDVDHLTRQLRAGKNKARGKQYVAVEAIYSMHGDACPLAEVRTVCQQHDALLILDEAHSTGVCGEKGRGMGCEHDPEDPTMIRIHTFGKALGVQGACVASSQIVKEYLVNYARPFIYTTAPSPCVTTSISCALSHLEERPELREQLGDNVRFFGAHAKNLPEEMYKFSSSPIQSFAVPTPAACRRVSRALLREGLCVWPILSPTVRKGQEHLRVCLHAFNTEGEMKKLLKVLTHAYHNLQP